MGRKKNGRWTKKNGQRTRSTAERPNVTNKNDDTRSSKKNSGLFAKGKTIYAIITAAILIVGGIITILVDWQSLHPSAKFHYEHQRLDGGFTFRPPGCFLFRGTVYNDGKKPLNIKELGVRVFYKNKWINLKSEFLPKEQILANQSGPKNAYMFKASEHYDLFTLQQVKAEDNVNGFLYCTTNEINVLEMRDLMLHETNFEICCIKTDNEMLCDEFTNIFYPDANDLRPYDR